MDKKNEAPKFIGQYEGGFFSKKLILLNGPDNWCPIDQAKCKFETCVDGMQCQKDYLDKSEALFTPPPIPTKEHPKSNDELLNCDCEPHTFYEWEKDGNKCNACGRKIYSSLVNQEDAVKFAEWINEKGFICHPISGEWTNIATIDIHSDDRLTVYPTTTELYQEYLKQNL